MPRRRDLNLILEKITEGTDAVVCNPFLVDDGLSRYINDRTVYVVTPGPASDLLGNIINDSDFLNENDELTLVKYPAFYKNMKISICVKYNSAQSLISIIHVPKEVFDPVLIASYFYRANSSTQSTYCTQNGEVIFINEKLKDLFNNKQWIITGNAVTPAELSEAIGPATPINWELVAVSQEIGKEVAIVSKEFEEKLRIIESDV